MARKPARARTVNRLLPLTALATLVVDQATKVYVLSVLDLDRALVYPVFSPWLEFRMAWNEGMNFGLLSSRGDLVRWFLILLAVAISVWMWRWAARSPANRAMQVFAGLLVGGAIGNVVDRLLYGAVADFLNMSAPWLDNPFSFNVADIAIFVGALGLVLVSGRDKTP